MTGLLAGSYENFYEAFYETFYEALIGYGYGVRLWMRRSFGAAPLLYPGERPDPGEHSDAEDATEFTLAGAAA